MSNEQRKEDDEGGGLVQIEILGSSSLGNAYIVNDGKTSLLLECGLPMSETQAKSYFRVSQVSACLISHQHL